ncbi:LacI family DNA-binding transcriptional regulator [Heyndrickxia acidicola]|uniref:LacI family DNA-binding transcriptional regulator n=1 Tax=Heyndrickxia acidicola TaxID=209389 RepID=A0ABU6MG49_9BACI|nr:LacI family DNA-binding transcriptional regulator [Heyndrickxia acidicola]MED1203388.1 LacI family DNA-binding transcriptional regulator [Heyndrickxia acidicola]
MDPTIKDVAKKANVSIATVSRILNDKPGFSVKTKTKVLRVIEELGYQPNAIARGLVSKRTHTIGVLMPTLLDMFAARILNGIDDYAHELGSSVIVCNTDNNGQRTLKYLRVLAEKRVDGIIFVSEYLKDEYYKVMSDMKVPIVLVSTMSPDYPVPFVKVDDELASFAATEYLLKQGHRRIAMIAGSPEDPIAGVPRIKGYRAALNAEGDEEAKELIVSTQDFSYESGMMAMEKIVDHPLKVTAVFASSDELAVGAMSYANKRGIRIPEDLSIIGYDNTRLAQMSTPPLTAVGQPLYEMGNKSAEMLFSMMNTGETAESCLMPYTIEERETVTRI